ncbi:MAG TPA: hypothetical protein VLE73_01510 [Candidatus Saccharimonadales bacterium]|nr:hypothetical protein [Candidatus Saccharimonadales bacterium]
MSELAPTNMPPYVDYPFMFGGGPLPEHVKPARAANTVFARKLIIPDHPGFVPNNLDDLVVETCAIVLTAADYRFGRNTAGLGAMAHEHEDGIWQYHTMPTFYHNGDGTRLAMLGTKTYMDFVSSIEGVDSPYTDRRTRLAALLTAAYDDLVFGKRGRGGDERYSAQLAHDHMSLQGFSQDVIEAVTVGIEASIFNEQTFSQGYDPAKGAEAVQRASLVGDLWATGTPRCTMNTFLLLVENLWKQDTAHAFGQVLRTQALNEALQTFDWAAESFMDFMAIAERSPAAVNAFGEALVDNRAFLLDERRFTDPRVTQFMRRALVENARLQQLLGYAIKERQLAISEAFRCAVSYADARTWQSGRRSSAALHDATSDIYSPEYISELLLTPATLQDILMPVSADVFYETFMDRYRRE